jgi:hypothetical protein
MPNKIQIKRTTTSGLLPNVSNSSNTSYIAAGELAINLTDRKLLSSNGSATFEIGANLASMVVGTAFTLTSGNANFDSGVLFVDGTNNRVGVNNTTPGHALSVTGTTNLGGVVTATANVILGTTTISANGSVGTAGQILTSGGSGNVYWSTGGGGGSPGGANTQIQFNDGGSFGGDAGLTYNKTTDALTVAGALTVNGAVTVPNTAALGNTTVTGFANVSTTATIGTGFTLTSGNANFDSGVLFVDGTNNRVGIGNTTPGHALSVTGTTNLGGFVNVSSTVGTNTSTESALRIVPNNLAGAAEWRNIFRLSSYYNGGANGHEFFIKADDNNRFNLISDWGNALRLGVVSNSGAVANAVPTTFLSLTTTAASFSGLTLAAGNTTITGFANVTTTATIGTGFTLTSGNANFDSGVLFVDGTNNRVGVGNTTPGHALSVTGTTNLGGAVTGITTLAAGNTTITGNLSASNFSGSSSGTNTGDQTNISGNAGTATTLQTARTITVGSTGRSFNGSADISWSLADIGAATNTHTHGLVRHNLAAPAGIDGLTNSNFRTTLFGSTTSGYQMSTARWDTVPAALTGLQAYSTMIAWAGGDTHSFLAVNYNTAGVRIGGGNGDTINWSKTLAFGDGTGASGNWGINITGSAGSVDFNNLTNKGSGTGTYTTSGDFRAPIFYDSNDTGYYFDGNSLSKVNQLTRRTSRVSANREYPLGHYTPGETVFEVDPTWSDTELRNYFGSNSVSWVADSTAPGGYAIAITGAVNVGGEYSSGFPYIPVDQDDIFYMEIWIKDATGTNNHYLGSNEYNESFTSLGGNPGSFGYWTMSASAPGTSWTKYSGYITGFGNSVGQFKSGTKYFTPMALFNYSGGGVSRISGWKIIKVSQVGNRTIIGRTGSIANNSTYALDVFHPTELRQLRIRSSTSPLMKFSGSYNGGDGAEIWQSTDGLFRINLNSSNSILTSSSGATTFGGDVRASIFYDSANTSFYLDPASTSVLNGLTVGGSQVMRGIGSGVDAGTNWNTLGNTVNTIYEIYQGAFNVGGTGSSNFPSNAAYKYGTLVNFSANLNARAQMYISHAGNDLIFRGGWTDSSWQTWNRVLTDINYNSYAPTLTGTGASGNWGINVTGTAASISGFNNPTTADTPNTIAYRTSAGDIAVREITLNSGLSTSNPTVLVSMFPTTNQLVRTTPAAVANAIQGAASGTWGINITGSSASTTGNAGTVTNGVYTTGDQTIGGTKTFSSMISGSINGTSRYLAHVDGPRNLSDRSPSWAARSAIFDFVGAGAGNGAGNYAGVLTFVPWDGTSGSTGDSSYQLAFGNQSGVNASGPAKLSIRNGINSTWNDWQEILTSSNFTSYALSNATGTWNTSRDGNARFYFTSGGRSYYRSADGHEFRNSGDSNISFIDNSGNFYNYSSVRSPIFYDQDNTSFYVDAQSTSVLYNLRCTSGFDLTTHDVYGSMRVVRNALTSGGTADGMYIGYQNGNSGLTRIYGGGAGSGELTKHSDHTTEANSFRAPIFYDSNDTSYRINANDNSVLNTLTMAGLLTGRSSGSTDVNSANDTGSISIRGSTTTVAAMSFHRTGAYAINMGLGTDNVFRIGGWSASSNALQMDGSGNLTMLNNVTAYSDARLKTDIVKIENAIDKVQQLNGYTYTRTDTGSRQAGVIAQEVMKVLPEVVMGSEETNYSVAYGNMVGLLIEAIKEQQDQINKLTVLVEKLTTK